MPLQTIALVAAWRQ